MSGDVEKKVSIVVGDGFFLIEKAKIGFFISTNFQKNLVISEGKIKKQTTEC